MSATPAEMLKNAAVTHYQFLFSMAYSDRTNDDHDPVRWATKVTLPDGRFVRLPDRLNRREALRQAALHLRHEQA
jgi:hypothetical protein